MDLATLAPWATAGISSGLAFLAIKWAVEWLSGRSDAKRANLDAGMMTLIVALQERVKDQDARIERIEKENASLRDREDARRDKERKLTEENHALRDHIAALETRLAALENMFKTLPLSPEMQEAIDALDKTTPTRRKRAKG